MKYFITFISIGIMLLFVKSQESPIPFQSEKEKVSYALGISFEKNLKTMEESMPIGESANVEDYIKGIESILINSNAKSDSYVLGQMAGVQIQNYLNSINAHSKLDYDIMYDAIRTKYQQDVAYIPEDSLGLIIQEYFRTYDEEARIRNEANRKLRLDKVKEKNTKASEAYLKQNASKEGVRTIADGVQMKVIQEGKGKLPTENDKVTINYVGKLVNGKLFDSSNKNPITNALTGFVPGFTTALKEMKKGGKYEILIPADQAYRDQAPDFIGPSQALIFEVELIDVIPFTEEELKQKAAQEKIQQETQQRYMQQMIQQQTHQ